MKKSIIYVNYAPYENTGNILDYILARYEVVLVFSLSFHSVARNNSNILFIYENGRLVKTYRLYHIAVPETFIFFLLPVKSIINLIEILFFSLRLQKKYGKFDTFFTVNAFTAWIGGILKHFSAVKKTVFWVWDYYPPLHANKVIVLMRWIYWQFDKVATTQTDRVVFLNKRLEELRRDIGILPVHKAFPIVPIGTELHRHRKKSSKKIRLCFIGVLKKSQGLGLMLENMDRICKKFPDITLDIIGGGPDTEYFEGKAKKYKKHIFFHGLLNTKDIKSQKIFENATIGLATYIPEAGNVSYYGDPSKIKLYLSYGLPVITTDVFLFSEELRKTKAGKIISYSSEELIEAFEVISTDYQMYQSNALQLAKKYDYQKMYKKIFE